MLCNTKKSWEQLWRLMINLQHIQCEQHVPVDTCFKSMINIKTQLTHIRIPLPSLTIKIPLIDAQYSFTLHLTAVRVCYVGLGLASVHQRAHFIRAAHNTPSILWIQGESLLRSSFPVCLLSLPEFVRSRPSAVGSPSCRDWRCWYVSFRGNSSRSYLRFILAGSSGSALRDKGCRVLCRVDKPGSVYCKHTAGGIAEVTYECGGCCHAAFPWVELQAAMEKKRMGERTGLF